MSERIARDRELVRARFERLLAGALEGRAAADLDLELVSDALICVAEHFGRLLIEAPERYSTKRLMATVESIVASALP